MYIGIQHRLRSEPLIVDFFCIILCIVMLSVPSACSTNRRIIKNPKLDDWDGERMRYKNLFPPQYGYLEETEYDSIDFRKPHEKGVKEYSLLSDPRGDIDRTKAMTRQPIRLPLTSPSFIILVMKFR